MEIQEWQMIEEAIDTYDKALKIKPDFSKRKRTASLVVPEQAVR